jgi:hypothetical protein
MLLLRRVIQSQQLLTANAPRMMTMYEVPSTMVTGF